ncbi:hypothetical protein EAI_07411 [Harpegnathos saltator]|uniref:Uncharacterized protein n=1 Tax=Harpegnathos saltator TaxID=610380 RepID=E2B597_HARSA|nr:hypothetical protein EAI_07411 [Harpegnathos saltator]
MRFARNLVIARNDALDTHGVVWTYNGEFLRETREDLCMKLNRSITAGVFTDLCFNSAIAWSDFPYFSIRIPHNKFYIMNPKRLHAECRNRQYTYTCPDLRGIDRVRIVGGDREISEVEAEETARAMLPICKRKLTPITAITLGRIILTDRYQNIAFCDRSSIAAKTIRLRVYCL